MIQLNVNIDLEQLADEEYGRSLKEVIRDAVSVQIAQIVRQEVENRYRNTVKEWLKQGFDKIQIVDGVVTIPIFTRENLK